MKIDEVNYTNLNKLYKAIASGKKYDNYKKELGRNMNRLLSHVSINIKISELSLLESVMLKMFIGDAITPLETIADSDFIDKGKYPVLNKSVTVLMNVINSIDNDPDVEVKPGECFLPTKCISKTLIATFTGNTVCNILSAMPEKFFIDTFQFANGSEFFDELPDDEDSRTLIKNSIAKEFVNNFFSFMNDKYKYMDILVDATIRSEYYQYTDETTAVTLEHVNTPYGGLNFLGDDANMLSTQLIDAKKNFTDVPMVYTDHLFKNIKLFYAIECSFYSFLEMYLELPFAFFPDYQDFKIELCSNELIFPHELEEYRTRILNRTNEMIGERDKIAASDEQLDKFNYILLNTKMAFTMEVSLEDISNTLCLYEKKILENKYYGETNQFFIIEILKIIEGIKTNSITIYSVLN